MDWQTVLSIAAFAGLFCFMMRGCGVSGGCGMGRRRSTDRADAVSQPDESGREKQSRSLAG